MQIRKIDTECLSKVRDTRQAGTRQAGTRQTGTFPPRYQPLENLDLLPNHEHLSQLRKIPLRKFNRSLIANIMQMQQIQINGELLSMEGKIVRLPQPKTKQSLLLKRETLKRETKHKQSDSNKRSASVGETNIVDLNMNFRVDFGMNIDSSAQYYSKMPVVNKQYIRSKRAQEHRRMHSISVINPYTRESYMHIRKNTEKSKSEQIKNSRPMSQNCVRQTNPLLGLSVGEITILERPCTRRERMSLDVSMSYDQGTVKSSRSPSRRTDEKETLHKDRDAILPWERDENVDYL